MMPSNHLIFCRPLHLLPSIFPSIRIFSNELALHIRWLKSWSFSFSISPDAEKTTFSQLNFVILLPSSKLLFAPCVCMYASIDIAFHEQIECENSSLFQDPGALIWAIILIMLFGLFWLMPWATRKPGGGSLIKWHPQFQSHIYQVLVGTAVRTLLLILLFTEFSTLNLALVLVLGIHNGKTPSLTVRNSSCGQGARRVIKQLHYTHTHTCTRAHTHTHTFLIEADREYTTRHSAQTWRLKPGRLPEGGDALSKSAK